MITLIIYPMNMARTKYTKGCLNVSTMYGTFRDYV